MKGSDKQAKERIVTLIRLQLAMLRDPVSLLTSLSSSLENMSKHTILLFFSCKKVHIVQMRVLGCILLDDFGEEGQDVLDHNELILVHCLLLHRNYLRRYECDKLNQ